MALPFLLPTDTVLLFGDRKIRFLGEIGDDILKFRYADGDEELLKVPCDGPDGWRLPTVAWVIIQFASGKLVDPQYNEALFIRGERYLGLDRSACLDIDSKTGWRFDWADRVITDRIKRNPTAIRNWIATHDGPSPKPATSSLLRWVKRLDDNGRRIGALVNCAGREKGQSQLPDVVDRIVHKWAMHYWRPTKDFMPVASIDDVATLVGRDWDRLREMGIPSIGNQEPSYECVRERVLSLECYSTFASRYGRIAADKKFLASGETVDVTMPMERIYMDGTEYEHSLFYSSEFEIPASKLKGVMAMDCFSQFIFPFTPFAGPFRPEMGLQALRSIMTPPTLTPEELEENPEALLFYGLPADIMIDRDKTLIRPAMIPNLVNISSSVELAEAYHPNAKARLENFHNFVKAAMRERPGQILGPFDKAYLGYNPIKDTQMTRAQYAYEVEQLRREWNSKPKDSLGRRSPNDIMAAYIRNHGPRLADPGEVWRALSSTPAKKCVLTKEGVTYDGIKYRWNREGVTKMLSTNARNMALADRLKRRSKLEVSIRTWDDNIDFIEVYDPENRDYHRLYSVDPGYTGGLSRWEHNLYKKYLKQGGTGAKSDRDRRRLKMIHLSNRAKNLAELPFRKRDEPTALMEAEERRLAGKLATNPNFGQVPELYTPTEIGGQNRQDEPTPPSQGQATSLDANDMEPLDQRSDPLPAILDDVGLGNPEAPQTASRWDFDDADEDLDADSDRDED